MAIFHFSAKIVSRGQGHSAVAAAAYRAREALLNERTGETHDYSRMENRALFTGIFVPKDAPDWAHDRAQLWNAVEQSEKRKDAQLARDFVVALPHELTDQQRQWLVQDFVREQFVRKGGYAVDVAIHAPHEQGDTRNHHAHVLVAMRTLGAEGFAAKKDRSLNSAEYLQGLRESWAQTTNRHLERHGIAVRIDHRTLAAQGIDREAEIHAGKDATAAQRKGHQTERGARAEAIKARNAERQQIREDIKTIEQEQQKHERPANATAARIFDARFASDGGKAFAAALAEQGLVLAQVTESDLAQVNHNRPADWRPLAPGDYVAVNQRGQTYELTERNTGLTRADRADWLKDVDGTLASVAEAQRTIETDRAAQHQARLAKPIDATQEAMRLAYSRTSGAQDFAEALQEQGIRLARVTDADRANRDAAKSPLSRYAKAGDLVAVTQEGRVYAVNSLTTGDLPDAMTAKLAYSAEMVFPSVTMTRALFDQQRQTAWLKERETEREAAREAFIEKRAAQLERDPTVQAIGIAYAESRTGPEFLTALQEHGLIVACVSKADATRAALQRDYGLRAGHYQAGEYVVFNEQGRSYRLDGTTIHDRDEHIFARLSEVDARQHKTLGQARQEVAERHAAQRQSETATARGQETARHAGMSAGQLTGTAGKMLGGVVKGILEPVLGALADFFTGTTSSPPAPTQEAPAPAPEPERPHGHGARIREQARLLSVETPQLDAQTETVARFVPQALSPEKEASIRRLAESQAQARERDNARGGDDRER